MSGEKSLTFLTVFGLVDINGSDEEDPPSEEKLKHEISTGSNNTRKPIELLGLVLEFLAGSIHDVVQLGLVNTKLEDLLLGPYQQGSPADIEATQQVWAHMGRILATKLMQGHQHDEDIESFMESFLDTPTSIYEQSNFLVARTSGSSPARNLLDRNFFVGKEAPDLKKRTQELDHAGNTMNGIQLRSLCYYLTRLQITPLRLFQTWLSSQKEYFLEANSVLEGFQLEHKLRHQVRTLLEQLTTAPPELRFNHEWREFGCAGAKTRLISQKDHLENKDQFDTEYIGRATRLAGIVVEDKVKAEQALRFLASSLNYIDHQVISSHDFNGETYKWDLRIGCRVECVVLGKRGMSANFKMRVFSDHCNWSAGSHLECVVSLIPTSKVVMQFVSEFRNETTKIAAGVSSQRPLGFGSAERQDSCDKPGKRGHVHVGPITAEMVAMGPAGSHSTENMGGLAGGVLKVNGFLLELVARELGIPEVLPVILWDFLRNAMVPRIPEVPVANHSSPRLGTGSPL